MTEPRYLVTPAGADGLCAVIEITTGHVIGRLHRPGETPRSTTIVALTGWRPSRLVELREHRHGNFALNYGAG